MKIVLDNMALQWKGGYISSPTQSGHFFQTVVAPFFLDKQFFFLCTGKNFLTFWQIATKSYKLLSNQRVVSKWCFLKMHAH